MKATEKELKCIKISQQIRDKVVIRKIKKRKKEKTIYLLNPKVFVDQICWDYRFTVKQMSFWHNIFFHLVLVIVYLISIPFVIIIGIYELIIREYFYKLKRKIINTYLVDNDVSSTKSFSKLWDDKGLRNWGIDFIYFDSIRGINKIEQKECLLEWFKILYDKDEEEFNNLCLKTDNEFTEQKRDYYHKHPNEFVSWVSLVQLLPDKISKIYGDYAP